MKGAILFVLCLGMSQFLHAQDHLSNITRALKEATNDSLRFIACQEAAYYWVELNRDSLLHYINECISLAQKNSEELEEAWGFASRGYCLTGMGDYSQALTNLQKAFAIVEDPKYDDQKWLPPNESGRHHRLYYHSYTHHLYAILMTRVRNYQEAIHHFREGKRIAQEIKVSRGIIWADMNLGFYYLLLNSIDSAQLFAKQAKELALKTPGENKYLGEITQTLAHIALKRADTVEAMQLTYEAIRQSIDYQNHIVLSQIYKDLTTFFMATGEIDSSLFYAMRALESAQTIGQNSTNLIDIGSFYENLSLGYQLNYQSDSALKYANLALVEKNRLANAEIASLAEFQKMTLAEQLRLQNLEKEKLIYQNRLRAYSLFSGLGVVLLIAAILYRNNWMTKRMNRNLNKAFTDLKSTQSQLIQSEKMASLGELTAGIAHEIQNPLNFVNNFSEVNKELADELEQEIEKGNSGDAKALARDIKENQEKILHHGKRADAIVKGMLQHSRSSSGQKELTDINALTEEYLRLSYHGLRAKDKSFNARFETDFDPALPMVSIIPQDIGRVILNLINNAFYAVSEKSKQGIAGYDPTVTVSTTFLSPAGGGRGVVHISVKDNGPGIPEHIKEKIFQPFFTTKPTGQGTGLGLSLSYDIVKAHGGELRVESKIGEGTEFIIYLA